MSEAIPLDGDLAAEPLHEGLLSPIAEQSSSTRIVLALGERLFMEAIRGFLDRSQSLCVVAETTHGHEAVSLCLDASPDLIVLDIDLCGMSGLLVAQRLRAAGVKAPAVLLLNTLRDAHHLAAAWAAGVRGFVLKQGTSGELLHALRVVRDRGTFFDAHLTRAMLAMRGFGGAHDAASGRQTASAELAPREREAMRLVALGFTSKEAAHQLGITARSVETYKARATEKLRLTTRASIVRYGIIQGWFT